MDGRKCNNPFELIIGLVGGVGTNFDSVENELESKFKAANCDVNKIKLTSFLDIERVGKSHVDFINEKIKLIDAARLKDPGVMSYLAISKIFTDRLKDAEEQANKSPKVFIINSIKNPAEYEILRRVYRRNFILLSVYETKKSRKTNLQNDQLMSHADCAKLSDIDKEEIEKLMKSDEYDDETRHGRNTLGTYHKAHYFIRAQDVKNDIGRFVDLLFNNPFITPTREEVGMMHAYISSLRSSDISRQVGAVILDDDGNVLASGCNEVPKFGGGLHWFDADPDWRDFQTINEDRMTISEVIKNKKISDLNQDDMRDSLEFFRAVHAEEAAICDAARRGIAIQDGILYCTVFPCHLCIKHIIASGIKSVVYIEPYIKSLAEELFEGLIKDKATTKDEGVVKLIPYSGVAPKRYQSVFRKSKKDRQDNKCTGRVMKWDIKTTPPIYLLHATPIAYFWVEYLYAQEFKLKFSSFFKINILFEGIKFNLNNSDELWNAVFKDLLDKSNEIL